MKVLSILITLSLSLFAESFTPKPVIQSRCRSWISQRRLKDPDASSETDLPREDSSPIETADVSNVNSLLSSTDSSDYMFASSPIPMFTGLIILFLSLYVTGYMFWVGFFGFPPDDTLPRVF